MSSFFGKPPAKQNQVEAVGPHACGSCSVSSCVTSKIMSEGPSNLVKQNMEALRSLIVEVDVSFRSGNREKASVAKEKVFTTLEAMLNSVKTQEEMNEIADAVTLMMNHHQGSEESLAFLLE